MLENECTGCEKFNQRQIFLADAMFDIFGGSKDLIKVSEINFLY